MKTRTSLITRQRGLAAVEATIVMPIMLLLVLAIGEFGRMLYQYNTLTQAVRAGARTVSASDNSGTFELTAEMEQKVRNLILYGQEVVGTAPVLPGLAAGDITFVGPFEVPAIDGDPYIQIRVSYSWQPMFGLGFNTFFGETLSLDFPLQTSMTMRVLQ
ncbi:TadE family protein [Zobellella sp. DQSA1]|uniref:TadE family protein n=1 Tax=Zobellella sp. DQSA1 TaxID=3342386 RepID=UPI0035BFD231